MSVALLLTFLGLIRREKIKNEFIDGSDAQQRRTVDNPVTRSFSEFRVEFNPHEIPLMVQRDQSGCAISGEWIEYRVAFCTARQDARLGESLRHDGKMCGPGRLGRDRPDISFVAKARWLVTPPRKLGVHCWSRIWTLQSGVEDAPSAGASPAGFVLVSPGVCSYRARVRCDDHSPVLLALELHQRCSSSCATWRAGRRTHGSWLVYPPRTRASHSALTR
jgi:hypothetical protein